MADGWTKRADGVWILRCPGCGAYGETKIKPAAPICGCGLSLDFAALRIERKRPG